MAIKQVILVSSIQWNFHVTYFKFDQILCNKREQGVDSLVIFILYPHRGLASADSGDDDNDGESNLGLVPHQVSLLLKCMLPYPSIQDSIYIGCVNMNFTYMHS